VHGQWACPSLTRRTGTLFCLAILPFCRLLSNSLLLHWSVIPPLSCCLGDLQTKIGIANRWETIPKPSGTDYTFTWVVFKTLGEPALGLQGPRLGCKKICAFFLRIASFGTHCVFFRGTPCAHTFMTPTLPRTIMSR